MLAPEHLVLPAGEGVDVTLSQGPDHLHAAHSFRSSLPILDVRMLASSSLDGDVDTSEVGAGVPASRLEEAIELVHLFVLPDGEARGHHLGLDLLLQHRLAAHIAPEERR